MSIETSGPQQAGGLTIKLHWNFKYCREQIEKVSYWLTDKQSISSHVSLSQSIGFTIDFPITINKPQILQVQLESLETINKLYTLYLSLKPDTGPYPVAIGESHRKKCQNHFRVTTSPVVKMQLYEMLEKKGIQKKIMDFDYCEEYLTSISNNILPWQCLEKQIFIQLTFQIF